MGKGQQGRTALMPGLHERLIRGYGGWVRYQSSAVRAPVFVRVEDRDGRLVLADLFVAAQGEGVVDATLLRSIPIGKIEAWVNDPKVAASIRKRMESPGPDLRRAVSYFESQFDRRHRQTWITKMLAAQIEGSGEDQPVMRNLDPPLPEFMVEDGKLMVECRVEVPKGRNHGDEFYCQVASIYSELLRFGSANPVATLAQRNNAPLSTVQRWVREARRRGFLPPARPGKAG